MIDGIGIGCALGRGVGEFDGWSVGAVGIYVEGWGVGVCVGAVTRLKYSDHPATAVLSEHSTDIEYSVPTMSSS